LIDSFFFYLFIYLFIGYFFIRIIKDVSYTLLYLHTYTSTFILLLQETLMFYKLQQTWQFGNDIQMILGDLHKHVG